MIVQSKPTGFAGRWSSIREVELYSTADGDEPVADFLNSLPPKHQAKAFYEIDLLAEFGNALKEPYVKHIKGDIWELRIRFSFVFPLTSPVSSISPGKPTSLFFCMAL